jgi:hypothetical protein
MSTGRLSGFMIVRNVERQGYPFIEAARAALSLCDELLISDGFSTDRTWPGLVTLREAFGERVQLFRDEWPDATNRGGVLAAMSNRVRRRCNGDYCLSVQANEVVHEGARECIAALPARGPEIEIFALPYLTLFGTRLAWTADWRGRLFRNIPDILALGDAYDVGNAISRRCPRHASLPPEFIYRYRALCPLNYVIKLRSVVPRTELWARELALAEKSLAAAQAAADPVATFWELVRSDFEGRLWEGITPERASNPLRTFLGTTDRAPQVMAHLHDRWEYRLEDSLDALAASESAP